MLLEVGVEVKQGAGGIVKRLLDGEVARQGVGAAAVADDIEPRDVIGLEWIARGVPVISGRQRGLERGGEIPSPPNVRTLIGIAEGNAVIKIGGDSKAAGGRREGPGVSCAYIVAELALQEQRRGALGADGQRRILVRDVRGIADRRWVIEGDGESVDAAVGGAGVIVELHRDLGDAIRIACRRIREGAAGIDGRLHAEQGVMIIADDEIHRLRGFVWRSGGDVGGPTGHALGATVFGHELVRALGKRGHLVDRVDRDRNRGQIAVCPIVRLVRERIGAGKVGAGCVGERTVGIQVQRSVARPVHKNGAEQFAFLIGIVAEDARWSRSIEVLDLTEERRSGAFGMLLKAGVKIEDVAGGIINRLPDREGDP